MTGTLKSAVFFLLLVNALVTLSGCLGIPAPPAEGVYDEGYGPEYGAESGPESGPVADSDCGVCRGRLLHGNCRWCAHSKHHQPNFDNGQIAAPWPRFHPVPTRPIFETREGMEVLDIIPRQADTEPAPELPEALEAS